jgi:prepilin-type N-terminal cleavage/methylation domain-containing protein
MITNENRIEICMAQDPCKPEGAGYWRKIWRMPPPTPHELAAGGKAERLRQAHRRGISITAPDWAGRTPLHFASVVDHPSTQECIGVLLNRGADPSARDHRGRIPEDWARENGNHGAVRLLHRWRAMSHERRAHYRAQAGFTLIEFLISLACFAVVSFGVYALFFSGSDSAELVRAQAETASLGSALMSAYVSRASFAGLTTRSATAEGWVPEGLKDASGLPVNAWAQPITLSAVDLDVAGDAKGARIEQGVPAPAACIRFVASVASGFDMVSVNDQELTPAESQDPSALAGPCGNAGDVARVVLVRRRM